VVSVTVGVVILIAFGGLAVVCLTLGSWDQQRERRYRTAAQARVALHGVRRRLEVAQVRAAVKADAARLRRELDRELSNMDGGMP
jgi:hypothetical protein